MSFLGVLGTAVGVGAGIKNLFGKDNSEELQERNFAHQKEMLGLSNDFAREMFIRQTNEELKRMGLQFNYNLETAYQSQQLAKEMWEYTGYGGQKRQMEENGINPALLYGGGGSGGQTTSGGSVPGVSSIAPMGIQVALQARSQDAQIQLAQAQAEKISTETNQMKTIGIINQVTDIVQKIEQIGLPTIQKKKLKTDMEQISTSIEQIKAQTNLVKENTKVVEFQNKINALKQKITATYETGAEGQKGIAKTYGFEDMVIAQETKKFLTENMRLDKEYTEMLKDRDVAARLYNDIDLIVQGKLNELSINETTLNKLKVELDKNQYELKNEKALGDIINDLGGDAKYSKLLLYVIEKLSK